MLPSSVKTRAAGRYSGPGRRVQTRLHAIVKLCVILCLVIISTAARGGALQDSAFSLDSENSVSRHWESPGSSHTGSPSTSGSSSHSSDSNRSESPGSSHTESPSRSGSSSRSSDFDRSASSESRSESSGGISSRSDLVRSDSPEGGLGARWLQDAVSKVPILQEGILGYWAGASWLYRNIESELRAAIARISRAHLPANLRERHHRLEQRTEEAMLKEARELVLLEDGRWRRESQQKITVYWLLLQSLTCDHPSPKFNVQRVDRYLRSLRNLRQHYGGRFVAYDQNGAFSQSYHELYVPRVRSPSPPRMAHSRSRTFSSESRSSESRSSESRSAHESEKSNKFKKSEESQESQESGQVISDRSREHSPSTRRSRSQTRSTKSSGSITTEKKRLTDDQSDSISSFRLRSPTIETEPSADYHDDFSTQPRGTARFISPAKSPFAQQYSGTPSQSGFKESASRAREHSPLKFIEPDGPFSRHQPPQTLASPKRRKLDNGGVSSSDPMLQQENDKSLANPHNNMNFKVGNLPWHTPSGLPRSPPFPVSPDKHGLRFSPMYNNGQHNVPMSPVLDNADHQISEKASNHGENVPPGILHVDSQYSRTEPQDPLGILQRETRSPSPGDDGPVPLGHSIRPPPPPLYSPQVHDWTPQRPQEDATTIPEYDSPHRQTPPPTPRDSPQLSSWTRSPDEQQTSQGFLGNYPLPPPPPGRPTPPGSPLARQTRPRTTSPDYPEASTGTSSSFRMPPSPMFFPTTDYPFPPPPPGRPTPPGSPLARQTRPRTTSPDYPEASTGTTSSFRMPPSPMFFPTTDPNYILSP